MQNLIKQLRAQQRFIIAMLALALLMTGPFLITALIFYHDLKDGERQSALAAITPRLPIGTMLTIFGFVIGVVILRKLYQQYVYGIATISEQIKLMLQANRNFRLAVDGLPEVKELASAVNALANQRDEYLLGVENKIKFAQASLEEERNRLATLVGELSVAVIVCNREAQIILYNNRAKAQFQVKQGASVGFIGLGRSIYTLLDRGQIDHAMENLHRRILRGADQPSTHFISASKNNQLLRFQMTAIVKRTPDNQADLAASEQEKPLNIDGYLLTFDNITRNFARENQRDQLFNNLSNSFRHPLGQLKSALDLENDTKQNIIQSKQIVSDLMLTLEKSSAEFTAMQKTRWPLEEVISSDFISIIEQQITKQQLLCKREEITEDLALRLDSFAMLQVVDFLLTQLKDHYQIREIRLRLQASENMAHFDLIWSGQPVSSETLYNWELEPMHRENNLSSLTIRDVMERHGGQIWLQREKVAHRLLFRIAIPMSSARATIKPNTPSIVAERPEYYDFNLFDNQLSNIDFDCPLDKLRFTVFDCETSGLNPREGDEIIQIGAVRMINARILRQESFERLIDPGFRLKAENIAIHGITQDMLDGQAKIVEVLPLFHQFCADSVLVGHNAAFDMRFLQLKEQLTGLKFNQPLLDTLLLSQVINPNQSSHNLEEIAKRLGIVISGRHTALGDALVTAEVFSRMIPLLQSAGLNTLGAVINAAKETYYAKINY